MICPFSRAAAIIPGARTELGIDQAQILGEWLYCSHFEESRPQDRGWFAGLRPSLFSPQIRCKLEPRGTASTSADLILMELVPGRQPGLDGFR